MGFTVWSNIQQQRWGIGGSSLIYAEIYNWFAFEQETTAVLPWVYVCNKHVLSKGQHFTVFLSNSGSYRLSLPLLRCFLSQGIPVWYYQHIQNQYQGKSYTTGEGLFFLNIIIHKLEIVFLFYKLLCFPLSFLKV